MRERENTNLSLVSQQFGILLMGLVSRPLALSLVACPGSLWPRHRVPAWTLSDWLLGVTSKGFELINLM